MAKEPTRFNQNKFGARRKLKKFQAKVKREEAKLQITAPTVKDGVFRDDDYAGVGLMSEEVFEAEMEKGFKRNS